ncbi:sulfotransferase family 2 domain-containing protein [Propylenella binzhouense]|uniref:Sulfotransferase family protein n=1 Tax=Propylenella binzhouense TaxID=2555902 RepID=A0A964WU26_9HYPH|nr:sulfotransferase family 2 domain-containing protein [Propylenella binzhouense]MYZ48604.1 hypothetical protein [Propylenella binzhouense]
MLPKTSAELRAMIDQMRASGELWVFQHIPKTAGSSIAAELSRSNIIRYRNIYITPETYLSAARKTDLLETQIEVTFGEVDPQSLDCVSGHFMRRHVETIARHRPVRLFTYVRDPVERIISEYRYSLTPKHPPHEKFAAQFPTIYDFVEAPISQNLLANYICADRDSFSDLDERLAEFAFVGTLRQYQMSFFLMMSFLGDPRLPAVHERKTESTEQNRVEVTPELQGLIRKRNEVDYCIYRKAVEDLRASRDAIMGLRQ